MPLRNGAQPWLEPATCKSQVWCPINSASTSPYYIHCVSRKFPTFKLSVILSNLNRCSKCLHCLKAYEICYKTHTTLPTSPYTCCYTNLGKLKIYIFCRYSADMTEKQTNCILIASSFVTHPQILIFFDVKNIESFPYWLQIKFLSKSCPRRWIPCWFLTNTAATSAVTNFQCHNLIVKVNK